MKRVKQIIVLLTGVSFAIAGAGQPIIKEKQLLQTG